MGRFVENISKFVKNKKLPWQLLLGIQTVISALALQEDSLVQLEWGYYVDIPVIKWFFAIFQKMDGWGLEVIFLMAGLACIFYLLREQPLQKNFWIRGLSVFFGICMIFGRSYYDLGNWNYIFHGRLQFGLACFVFLGYYWVFKNVIILLCVVADKGNLRRNVPERKVEKWLFAKHPFLGPLLVIAVCCLPILICFFPGTLQWDAHEQFWTYIGVFKPWTSLHPVAVTWLLGKCLYLSRAIFGGDSMALFFYAGPQYLIQWLVFAYGCYVLGRLKAPLLLRWSALVYFAVFPLWQIWGFTVVKDSYYYIFLFLFLLLLIHILESKKVCRWQYILIAFSSMAVVNTRNNGIHVLIPVLAALLLLYRKYWKICVLSVLCIFLSRYAVQNFYTEPKEILPGPLKEALSVPLQQTARYAKEHYEEITDEEMDVLSWMFNGKVEQLGELYNPEISDPVKSQFISYPETEDLKAYFEVWFAQLCKHPDTYIQAWLNHTYGYFYPNREQFWDVIGRYYIANAQHWQDGHLDMEFAMEYRELRDMFEQEANVVNRLPLVGMLYSCGFHNYILIGCITFLLARKKYKELIILTPSILTVLVCLVSPVDAYIRYMLPVMAALPINIAWCFYAVSLKPDAVRETGGEKKAEIQETV